MYLLTHSLVYTTALIERQERGRASQIRQQNGQKSGRFLLQVPVYTSLSQSSFECNYSQYINAIPTETTY